MSQHYYPTQYQGREVTVVMGWDRPLQGFFMFVEDSDADEPIYHHLKDRSLARCLGLPKTLEPFLTQLAAMGIGLSKEMVQRLKADGCKDVGNRYYWYDGGGKCVREMRG